MRHRLLAAIVLTLISTVALAQDPLELEPTETPVSGPCVGLSIGIF